MTRELLSAAETTEPTKGSLDEVLRNETEDRLLRVLDRIDARVREVRKGDARRPAEPEIVARLAGLAAGADAPFEVRWLGDRVAAGELTWDQVWLAPEDHAGGLWLWSRVAVDVGRAAHQEDA